jgi:hypothetical protein
VGIKKPSTQYLTVVLAISTTIFLLVLGFLQKRNNQPRIDNVQKSYQKLCARTEQITRRRHPSEGPQEYADAICKLRPDLATELKDLFMMYVHLRYDGSATEKSTKMFLNAVENFKPSPLSTAAVL